MTGYQRTAHNEQRKGIFNARRAWYSLNTGHDGYWNIILSRIFYLLPQRKKYKAWRLYVNNYLHIDCLYNKCLYLLLLCIYHINPMPIRDVLYFLTLKMIHILFIISYVCTTKYFIFWIFSLARYFYDNIESSPNRNVLIMFDYISWNCPNLF